MDDNEHSQMLEEDVAQFKPPAISGDPTPFDILLGKERAIFNHTGNKKFREIINQNLNRYMSVPSKTIKSKLIREIYNEMKTTGFRFLKRDNDTNHWHEISDQLAREKVSHALRDRVKELKKPLKRRSEQISSMSFAGSIAKTLCLTRATTEPVQHWAKTDVESDIPNACTDNLEPIPLKNESSAKSKRRSSFLGFGGFSDGRQERRNGLIIGKQQRRSSFFNSLTSNNQVNNSRRTQVAQSSSDQDVHMNKDVQLSPFGPEAEQMHTSFNSSFFNLFCSDDRSQSTRPPMKKRRSSIFSLFGSDHDNFSSNASDERPAMTKQSSILSLFGSNDANSTSNESGSKPTIGRRSSIYNTLFGSDNSNSSSAGSGPSVNRRNSFLNMLGSENSDGRRASRRMSMNTSLNASFFNLFTANDTDEKENPKHENGSSSDQARSCRRSSVSSLFQGIFLNETDDQAAKRRRLSVSDFSPQNDFMDDSEGFSSNRRLSVTGIFGGINNVNSDRRATNAPRRSSVESLCLDDLIDLNENEKSNRRTSLSNMSLGLGSITIDETKTNPVKMDHTTGLGSVNLLDSLIHKYENEETRSQEDSDNTLGNLIDNFGTQYQSSDKKRTTYTENCNIEFSSQIPVNDGNFSFH